MSERGHRPQGDEAIHRLAARVRDARVRKRWSLRDLAVAADLNHEAVRRIELGTADPRWSVIARLARALDISARDLQQIMSGGTARRENRA